VLEDRFDTQRGQGKNGTIEKRKIIKADLQSRRERPSKEKNIRRERKGASAVKPCKRLEEKRERRERDDRKGKREQTEARTGSPLGGYMTAECKCHKIRDSASLKHRDRRHPGVRRVPGGKTRGSGRRRYTDEEGACVRRR